MKINSNLLLYVIYALVIFTLFYTFQNNFSVFLLTLLLVLSVFWSYLYFESIVSGWENKINKVEKIIYSVESIVNNKISNFVKNFPEQLSAQLSNQLST